MTPICNGNLVHAVTSFFFFTCDFRKVHYILIVIKLKTNIVSFAFSFLPFIPLIFIISHKHAI